MIIMNCTGQKNEIFQKRRKTIKTEEFYAFNISKNRFYLWLKRTLHDIV